MVKKVIAIGTTKTNVDNLIGKGGVVFKKITTYKPGQVKVEGEIWRASSEKNHEVGEMVVVESVSGVTLQVR